MLFYEEQKQRRPHVKTCREHKQRQQPRKNEDKTQTWLRAKNKNKESK